MNVQTEFRMGYTLIDKTKCTMLCFPEFYEAKLFVAFFCRKAKEIVLIMKCEYAMNTNQFAVVFLFLREVEAFSKCFHITCERHKKHKSSVKLSKRLNFLLIF